MSLRRARFLGLTAGACAAAGLGVSRNVGAAGVAIAGKPDGRYWEFDGIVANFMLAKNITAGQFAFGRNGAVLFSHAYTLGAPPYMQTQTGSILRVASLSKAFTSACITTLLATKAFTLDTPLFAYLGIDTPLLGSQTPDRHAGRITIGQVVAHTSGLNPSGQGDPEFQYRKIENAIDAAGPLTQAQFARYVYGLPLQSIPGDIYAYSNVGYFLLGRVVEKASGRRYLAYLRDIVLEPLGITDVALSATAQSGRLPNEVAYDAPGEGLSVLEPRSQTLLPMAYGGATYWETFDACSDIATSAESLVKLIGRYAAWGIGGRAPGSARAGNMPGTQAVIENRHDGVDYAFAFNKWADDDPYNSDFRRQLSARIDQGV